MRGNTPLPVRRWENLFPGGRWGAMLAVGLLHVALGGCATWQAPEVKDEAGLRVRAVTETVHDVRLRAAVLSASESRQLFGAEVNATGIQPVWVEVENASPDTLWLLRAGTDPDYFAPLEVAWSFHAPMAGMRNAALDDHFAALAFQNPIPPSSTRAGIIFTNPHHRTKLLNVDLLGQRRMVPFTLFLPVPDDPPDEQMWQLLAQYRKAEHENIDDADTLRAMLERLPCCAANARGAIAGEPFNVVLVGEFDDIGAALVRRGFRSLRVGFDGAQRLFGRPPDIVLRKAGQGGVPATWIRGWVAPLRYRSQPVFLVQAGRPIGGRFAIADRNDLVLHPDVDEARNLLIQDLLYSGGLAKLGFVGGVQVTRPRGNVTGSKYFTDGLRAVMFFATRPLALSDFQLLDWVPYLERRGVGAPAENTDVRQ
ncbi:MAG: LssY C-terminal domain-containing protein [Gammaproteobacteria bacterium]